MAQVSRDVLYTFFETGDRPTAAQFASLIQSLLHYSADRKFLGLKTYDPTQIYLTGDTVVQNQEIFQAQVQTGGGAFNPGAWSKIAGSVEGALIYKGIWDADFNQPNLLEVAVQQGHYYVVSVAGNTDLDGITDWQVGDWAIYNGTKWEKVDNTDMVSGAENVAGAGVGVFKQKSGTQLEFKKIQATDASLFINTDAGSNFIDLGINFDDSATSETKTWSSQKIEDELNTKTEKPGVFTPSKFLVLDADGNLVSTSFDSSNFMAAGTTATGIPSTATGNVTATNVQSAIAQLAGYTATAATNISTLNGTVSGLSSTVSGLSSSLTEHVENMSNPHNVNKEQVDLGDVLNEPQLSMVDYAENLEPQSTDTHVLDVLDKRFGIPSDGSYAIEWYCEAASETSDFITGEITIVYASKRVGIHHPLFNGSAGINGFSGFVHIDASKADGIPVIVTLQLITGPAGSRILIQNIRVRIIKLNFKSK